MQKSIGFVGLGRVYSIRVSLNLDVSQPVSSIVIAVRVIGRKVVRVKIVIGRWWYASR